MPNNFPQHSSRNDLDTLVPTEDRAGVVGLSMGTPAAGDGQAPSQLSTRIAWLAPSLDRGWRWQVFWREFCKLCPDTVIFTGFWPGFTKGFEQAFRIHKVHGFKRLNSATSGVSHPKGFMWASPRLLYDLLRFRPEIIVTNGFHLCTIYAVLVKALLRSRLVLLWQGVSAETGGEAGTLRLKVRRILGRFFDMAVCNTRSGVEYLENLVGMPPGKVRRFIGEVAEKESFPHAPPGQANLEVLPRPRFLFVGRLIRGKGVDSLLNACGLLVERGIDDFSLVLVGSGAHEADFFRLAHRRGLDRHVRWEGFVPYEKLRPYYEACDVFVLPSIEDTWGVVALEAMAFGKPVLCSRLAGASEVVEDGVNGHLFDPYRPEELADYMARLIRHPELISIFGKVSSDIMARHTPGQAAQDLSQILFGTLGPKDHSAMRELGQKFS